MASTSGACIFWLPKEDISYFICKSRLFWFLCEVCELAKSHRVPYPSILNKSSVSFMVMHFDVWGLSKVTTLGGLPWFVTFIDDCIRITCVCLMKSKGEVNLLFQNFHKMLHTQYNTQV